MIRITLITALTTITLIVAGCGGSGTPSKLAQAETHNCHIAQIGETSEVAFRTAIEPDVTTHSGAAVVTTIDSYADSGITMTYQDGTLIAKNCG